MLTEAGEEWVMGLVDRSEYGHAAIVKLNLDGPVNGSTLEVPIGLTQVLEHPTKEDIQDGKPFVCPDCRWANQTSIKHFHAVECSQCGSEIPFR